MTNQNFQDKIICGSVPDAMAPIPDGTFQTCITSPPYWGLRDYGLEPIVWDGDPECDHEWANTTKELAFQNNLGNNGSLDRSGIVRETSTVTTGFCVHCGAWLGCLGLEPTPELYVDHLVQIFAEVKRVLRDDGTLWLNIGDSYAMSSMRGGDKPVYNFTRKTKTESVKAWNHGIDKNFNSLKASGLKPKDMVMIPFRLALALQTDGWYVRSDIIWHKNNCMPSSVKDRPTTDFEHVFLLAKSKKYYYDQDAIREPHKTQEGRPSGMERQAEQYRAKANRKYTGVVSVASGSKSMDGHSGNSLGHPKGRNKRTVWSVNTKPYKDAHFATFPPKLIEPMILAGSAEGDIVFDPFAGSGTTLAEAKRHGRHYCGIEANPEYVTLIEKRIAETVKAQLKLDLGGAK